MSRGINRVATISVHTSPLDQPGTGDAGGLNVYVVEVAKRLAARGVEVDIFTRATSRALPPAVELAPGVLVRNVVAGPFEELDKTELPRHLCGFTSGVLRAEAAHEPGHYDLLHTHYWLSGQAGWAAKERWGVPLVHSMHTMAKVKNAALAEEDKPEPAERVLGEEQVVASADQLVANTAKEARELVDLYGADPSRVAAVSPGVDLSMFRPESPLIARGAGLLPHRTGPARRRLGLPRDAYVLLFVGRIQPLKAPDVLLRAVARMLADDPELRSRLVVAVVGGPSGSGLCRPEGLQLLAAELGISDVMRFEPPAPQHELADWYRAADVTVVPSRSESFGLVAVESQACGTPVVASRVGGLCTAVADGESGVLVSGHDPADYAAVLRRLHAEPGLHARLARGAVRHARDFGWDTTVDRLLDVYTGAVSMPNAAVEATV